MDDPRFSICAITTPKWDLGQCVDGWARHGVPAIGVTRVGLNEYGRQEGIRRLKDSGLRVTDYQGIGRYGHDHPRIGEVIDSFMGDLDAAAELGVDCVFVMSGPRDAALWEEAAKRFTEELRLLLPHAKERGLRLAIEPIHPMRQDLTFVNTAKDAYDIITEIGDPDLGYVFDFWHLWFAPDIEEQIRRTAASIFNVQISDHKAMTLRTLDRTAPGEGIAPCTAMLRALEEAGYGGYYEMEIVSPDNEEMGYDAAIERSIESYRRLREAAAQPE